MKIKKYLNGNQFIEDIKHDFKKVTDPRSTSMIPLDDALMSAFAMFQLKFPSLLKFEETRKSKASNLNRIFKIAKTPSDTQMREIIDRVETNELELVFKTLFKRLQEAKVLEQYKYIGDYVLISSDGTGTFSSDKVHCECCIEKYHKGSKATTYHHQCLAQSIVHPEKSTVIPLCPEIIKKEDGFAKNDCEYNASKRSWIKFRKDHPQLKSIVIEDGLSANNPHIELLKKLDLRYIIVAKELGNASLFNAVTARESSLQDVRTLIKNKTIGEKVKKDVQTIYRFVNSVSLNQQEGAQVVNFVELIETTSWVSLKGEEKRSVVKYAWITDLEVSESNVEKICIAGRSRWKIENETFNTLKNQGYNFEHNYGHGYRNLSSNFTYIMMMAFLFDQALEGFCELYKKLREITRTRYSLWEAMRAIYRYFEVNDWNHFLEMILCKESNTC